MEPKTTEIFVLTADHRSRGDRSTMVLFGASKSGPVEVVSEYTPYFFVDARASLDELSTEVPFDPPEARAYTALSGQTVRKLAFRSTAAAERAKSILLHSGIPQFESDLRPRERFLMDHGVNGGARIVGPAAMRGGILRFQNPAISGCKTEIPLKVCSLDIETSISSGSVLSFGVHLSGAGAEDRRVFMLGDSERSSPSVSFYASEAALFAAFISWFNAADPDIIIGWNVIGFDLHFLLNRAEKLGVPLPLGRDGKGFSLSERTGRFSRAYIPGRVVLDGPQLLRGSFHSFESYSLENVSQQVLGEGKLIGPVGNKAYEIERLFREEPEQLASYNLKDAVLVTRIFEKLKLLDLTMRRTELSGMLLDSVGMSTASLDHFYLPRLHAEGFAAPNVGAAGDAEGASGGYVMSPIAGIYDDVIGLDFQSLYPTIIRSFNIDPLSRACAKDTPIVTPAGFKFSRSRSILPPFIAELMQERRRAKEEANATLSQAIKILMNSFYGVMGSLGSRLYHPDLPEAITSTGQWLLMESRRHLEELGHTVIYGDTDSLFIKLSNLGGSADFSIAGRTVAREITDWWRGRLREEFELESFLQLDFKRHYLKFLAPSARGGEGGAKKRYAGLIVEDGAERVEFVGLEVMRSDWTKLAQDFQQVLYRKVFKDEPIDEWIRDFVAKVRGGSFDDKLIYRKRLHKPIDEYGASPPPYVRAARMLKKPGRDVRYMMTLRGPVPMELSPSDPDYTHYIEKQLKPVADSILEVMGRSFAEVLSSQLRLF